MRAATKYRLIYFISAIGCFFLGRNFLPETLDSNQDIYVTLVFASLYFLALPILYWVGVIKIGGQKVWKMLIAISLSALIARYTLPTDIAQYLDFMVWIRYPLIAVLLILELYISYIVIRGLWEARKAQGDPRVTALETYHAKQNQTQQQAFDTDTLIGKWKRSFTESKKESQLAATLALSSEPASWYYAIPYFSRNHLPSLGKLNTSIAKFYHVALVTSLLFFTTYISLTWLVQHYEYFAYFIAVVCSYSLIFTIGNYRLAKRYSVYFKGNHLIISKGLWSISRFNIDELESVKVCETQPEKEQLTLGRIVDDYVKLSFSKSQVYYGMMGQFPEEVIEVNLAVEKPAELVNAIKLKKAQP